MTEAEALAVARVAASLRLLFFSRHAEERMGQRRVRARDVSRAILSTKHATWRAKEGNWKFSGGRDVDGEDLDVGVAFEGTTVRICTVF